MDNLEKVESTPSVEAKKQFLRWFLNRCKLNSREEVWLLNYIAGNDTILKNLHFVEKGAEYTPRGLTLGIANSKTNFRLYDGGVIVHNVENAYERIKRSPEKELFVVLDFPKAGKYHWLIVEEENRYLPPFKTVYTEEADKIVEHLEKFLQSSYLETRIDLALKEGDKETFMELSAKVKELSE